jgi:hypothetical protein
MGQTAGGHIAWATPHPSAPSAARHAGSGPGPGPGLSASPCLRNKHAVQLRSWAGAEPGGEHNGGGMLYVMRGTACHITLVFPLLVAPGCARAGHGRLTGDTRRSRRCHGGPAKRIGRQPSVRRTERLLRQRLDAATSSTLSDTTDAVTFTGSHLRGSGDYAEPTWSGWLAGGGGMETMWSKRRSCAGEPARLIGSGRSAGEVMRLPDPARRSGRSRDQAWLSHAWERPDARRPQAPAQSRLPGGSPRQRL